MEQMEDIQWPEDMGEAPPELWIEAILEAAMTFPTGTGLGWDGLHPRCLQRVSKELLAWLVLILKHAEVTGKWQAAVGLVIIVLLPKPDGGFQTHRTSAAAPKAVDANQERSAGEVGEGEPSTVSLCWERHGCGHCGV